jgi:rRNA maturation endonuclease Nob1
MATPNYTKSSTSYAIDTIYVCLSCKKREKELALKDRIQKICSECGGQSVKSTLVDSLSFVSGEFTPEHMKEYTPDEQ